MPQRAETIYVFFAVYWIDYRKETEYSIKHYGAYRNAEAAYIKALETVLETPVCVANGDDHPHTFGEIAEMVGPGGIERGEVTLDAVQALTDRQWPASRNTTKERFEKVNGVYERMLGEPEYTFMSGGNHFEVKKVELF